MAAPANGPLPPPPLHVSSAYVCTTEGRSDQPAQHGVGRESQAGTHKASECEVPLVRCATRRSDWKTFCTADGTLAPAPAGVAGFRVAISGAFVANTPAAGVTCHRHRRLVLIAAPVKLGGGVLAHRERSVAQLPLLAHRLLCPGVEQLPLRRRRGSSRREGSCWRCV